MHSRVLRISGMTCACCATLVEKALLRIPGVHQAQLSYSEALACVSGEPTLDPTLLFSALEAAGYGATLDKAPGWLEHDAEVGKGDSRLHIAVIGSIRTPAISLIGAGNSCSLSSMANGVPSNCS